MGNVLPTRRRKRYLAFATAAALVLYYRRWYLAQRDTELVYPPRNKRIQRILARIETQLRSYLPPWWAPTSVLQLIVYGAVLARPPPSIRIVRKVMSVPDRAYDYDAGDTDGEEEDREGGSDVSLDWLLHKDDADDDGFGGTGADDARPIIAVLPTITGKPRQYARLALSARARGYRVVVFNRRGHAGLRLRSARFNIMGDAHDCARMVAALHASYPRAFLGMVGLSAGSGLVVRYLGEAGARAHTRFGVGACVSISPGYNIAEAFARIDSDQPFYGRKLVEGIQRVFLKRNRDVLAAADADAFAAAERATTMVGFIRAACPLMGAGDTNAQGLEEYWKMSNPMEVAEQIRVPTLVINAMDDPICLPSNVEAHQHLFDRHPDMPGLLVKTKLGSHCAFRETVGGGAGLGLRLGPEPGGDWSARITLDFIDAVRATMDQPPEEQD